MEDEKGNINFKENEINTKMNEREKNLKKNYDYYIQKTGNNSIDLYINKINHYIKIYFFTQKYTNSIIQLFKRICEPLYSSISSSFLNEIKPLLKYFKEISSVYINLSNEMKKIHIEIEKFDNNKSLLLGEDSSNLIYKTNNIIYDNFNVISNDIKKVFLSNSSFSKIDTVHTKFENNFKKMISLVSDLEIKRQEHENLYIKNYEKQFELFKSQIKSPDILIIIQDFIDYVLIEYNLISFSNQMFIYVNHFLNEITIYIKNSKDLMNEYINLLKQCMEIYHNQISRIFNMNLYNTFGDINKFNENSNKLTIDEKLSVKKLLENNTSINTIKDFNQLFSQFQENLIKNNEFINNEDIKDDNNFKSEKYNSLEELINFLINLIPKNIEINYNELIIYKTNCKRIKGILKGIKNSFIVITIQGHILIFDEDKENNNEDIISNKLYIVYNKSKVAMKKKKSKKSNFMIVIWEIGNNKKKIKKLVIDTLNNDNLNNCIKFIGGLVDEKDNEDEEEEKDDNIKVEEI